MGVAGGMTRLCVLAILTLFATRVNAAQRPNIVIFFGDDWGWGDLGANWPPTKALGLTPNLDKLAENGLRFTDFHAAASVCTPSRAGLLTGRLGVRTGVTRNFGPSSIGGLPLNETTIAELLRPHGYRTGMIGKWHLGTANGHHPLDRGFQAYVGLPYSNDMGCSSCQAVTYWDVNHTAPGHCPSCAQGPRPVGGKDYSCHRDSVGGGCIDTLALPIFYNRTIKQQPVDLRTVSTQYATAGARFVADSVAAGTPFFLYVANSHVHVPQNHAAVRHILQWLTAPAAVAAGKLQCVAPGRVRANRPARVITSQNFSGKSGIGPFGDALMEMDWEIGEIVRAVRESGAAEDTLILVSGDNGPWECKCNLTGSSGPYVGAWQKANGGGSSRKTTLWEGGHRQVGIAHWPGKIAPGRVSGALASTLDFFPTVASLAGVALPSDREFDGVDLTPVLTGAAAEAHTTLFHPLSGACGSGTLAAVRLRTPGHDFKAVYQSGGAYGCWDRPNHTMAPCVTHDPPLVFDLATDPGEAHALDPAGDPAVARAVAMVKQALAAKVHSVATTPRSHADYSSGPAGKAANCCNEADPLCRCNVTTVGPASGGFTTGGSP